MKNMALNKRKKQLNVVHRKKVQWKNLKLLAKGNGDRWERTED